MKLTAYSIFAFVCMFIAAYAAPNPVCIIGAGPGGLTTATLLQEKGYRTIVFEKNNRVGGKCHTLHEGKYKIDMGALFLDDSYVHVKNLLVKYGFHTVPVLAGKTTQAYDFTTGAIVDVPFFNISAASPEIRSAVNAFEAAIAKYPELSNGSAGHHVNHPELNVPFAQWLASLGLEILLPFFTVAITNEGYGSATETPAIYALILLNNITSRSLAFFEIPLFTIVEGWQTLMERVAADLPDVRLGAKIVNVHRPHKHESGPVEIYYLDHHNRHRSQACDSVVVAFPQLLKRMGFLHLDAAEKALFSQVQVSSFFTSAIHAPGLNFQDGEETLRFINGTETEAPVLGQGEPLAFLPQLPGVLTAYSWFHQPPMHDNKLITEVKSKVVDFVHRVTKDAEIPEFIEVVQWDYFPHVGTEALNNGFYNKAEAIQGYRKTYYTGGLFAMETVERTMNAAFDLVENHF